MRVSMVCKLRSLGISNLAFFFLMPSDLNTNVSVAGLNRECLKLDDVSAASDEVVEAHPP